MSPVDADDILMFDLIGYLRTKMEAFVVCRHTGLDGLHRHWHIYLRVDKEIRSDNLKKRLELPRFCRGATQARHAFRISCAYDLDAYFHYVAHEVDAAIEVSYGIESDCSELLETAKQNYVAREKNSKITPLRREAASAVILRYVAQGKIARNDVTIKSVVSTLLNDGFSLVRMQKDLQYCIKEVQYILDKDEDSLNHVTPYFVILRNF